MSSVGSYNCRTSLMTQQNFDVYPTPNTWQSKYDIGITSQVTCQRSAITLWEAQESREFKPKTEFVKKLLALREHAIVKGIPLLTVDEILAEKRALRGEID